MEANVSGFTFFSTFDSGNLASVEAVPSELHPLHGLPELEAEEMPAEKGGPLSPTDYSFRMWTRPDCAGMYALTTVKSCEFETEHREQGWHFIAHVEKRTDTEIACSQPCAVVYLARVLWAL
jgi:hypothetical protein